MSRTWSESTLEELPEAHGFRLRGAEMTRLETFIDAAFAFAMTMVVISVNEVPRDYGELVTALEGVPAFAAGFALISLAKLPQARDRGGSRDRRRRPASLNGPTSAQRPRVARPRAPEAGR